AGGDADLPEDLALEVALGDALAVVLGDEDAVAGQPLGVPGVEKARHRPAHLPVLVPLDELAVVGLDEQGVAQLAGAAGGGVAVHHGDLGAVLRPPAVPGRAALD